MLQPPNPLPIIRCYFNELCLDSPFSSLEEAKNGFEELLELVRLLQRRTWNDSRPGSRGEGQRVTFYNLDPLLYRELTPERIKFRDLSSNLEKEQANRLRNLFSKSPSCAPNGSMKTLASVEAHGLTCALENRSLAVSLQTLPCWNTCTIQLDCGTRVDHLADSNQLSSAEAWFAQQLGQFSDFLRLVQPEKVQHKLASEYQKHVKGKSNDDRKNSARIGDGQYVATLHGRPFSDEGIIKLEQEAIYCLREGRSDARLERHSESTFYIYYKANDDIGYLGGAGTPTGQIRVEWCNGEVHSHPRKWP